MFGLQYRRTSFSQINITIFTGYSLMIGSSISYLEFKKAGAKLVAVEVAPEQ